MTKKSSIWQVKNQLLEMIFPSYLIGIDKLKWEEDRVEICSTLVHILVASKTDRAQININ